MDDLAQQLDDALDKECAEQRPDVRAVLARGRRLRLYRTGGVAASAAALLLVSGLGLAAATDAGSDRVTDTATGGPGVSLTPDLGENESPFEPDPEREVTFLPEGPRYAVAQGTFDDSWGGDSGKRWRLMVWGDHVTYCWAFEIGETSDRNEGVSCSSPGTGPYAERGEVEPFVGLLYIPANGERERAIALGAVSREVDHLAFAYRNGGVVNEKAVRAPNQTTIQDRFFVVFLAPETCGSITAFDQEGRELARKPIVRGGCK